MRVRNWDTALIAWAEGAVGAPFVWGETDCAMLCFCAYDILTGAALAAQYEGMWSSEATAKRFILAHKLDLQGALERAGCRPVQRNFQQRGDLILVRGAGWMSGHVCLGENSLSSRTESGVGWVRTAELLAAKSCLILRAP